MHGGFKSIIDSKVLCKFFPFVFICQLLTTKNNNKNKSLIKLALSTTSGTLSNAKGNSSFWQTCSFHSFTVFNGSEISYSFYSASAMPES